MAFIGNAAPKNVAEMRPCDFDAISQQIWGGEMLSSFLWLPQPQQAPHTFLVRLANRMVFVEGAQDSLRFLATEVAAPLLQPS